MSKEETRCLEKIDHFLLIPLRSRATLLLRPNRGLAATQKPSSLTARRVRRSPTAVPRKPGSPWLIHFPGVLTRVKIICLETRYPPINKNPFRKALCTPFKRSIFERNSCVRHQGSGYKLEGSGALQWAATNSPTSARAAESL